MSVARLNLSHDSFDGHHARLERIRQAAANLNRQVAIMIDTRGIEVRTGLIPDGSIDLVSGEAFSIFTDGRAGDKTGVSVTYPNLSREINPGQTILLDDGAMELNVESIHGQEIRCRVVLGGVLRESKGVNLPDTQLSVSSVDPKNREDIVRELTFAAQNDVDYIAASFIQGAADIVGMREILSSHDVDIPIIAKIENRAGMDNLDEIIAAADGIMVARGDLGVELPMADVPGMQKKMIRMTVSNGKPVITATQMLASMEENPKPTRAEASDVANAILDGSSAVMLSGESAAGKYPVESVKTLAELAVRTEATLREYGYLQHTLPHHSNVVTEAVAQAAVQMADQLSAPAIISLTESGFTSRLVSKHRPECPILAVTESALVTRRLCMNWGVLPALYEGTQSDDAKIAFAMQQARRMGIVEVGDTVIVTCGYEQTTSGGTNMIRTLVVDA